MDKSSSHTLTILEQSTVCPPPGVVAVQSLPLTFYDFLWLNFRHATRVIFFNFPHSTAYFTENIVPCLKTSLSLALKHFTPLAGKLITPFHASDSTVDIHIRYLEGHDSLSLTFAECTGDINHYCGNHVREADILKPLVPELPAPTCIDISGENCSQVPVFAIQVTVFPNSAICIGMTNSHAAADGRSIFDFVKAWATIAKQLVDVDSGADEELDTNELVSSGCIQIPNYDRSLIRDPYGLGDMFKKTLRSAGGTSKQQQEQVVSQKKEKIVHQDPSDIKVRATFVITEANIQALKKIVSTQRPTITYLSTFTVACAYLWTCFAKTRATVYGEAHKLDEAQNFGFVMDCRARLDPPLPASYFGNCLVYCLGVVTGRVMIAGDEGLATGAEALGNSIYVKIKEGALHGSDKWLEQFAGVMRGEWHVGVAGSPKLDYYNNIDFGWGKPIKFEFVDGISISKCKDSKTDLEIGIVLPKKEMDVFSTVFVQGLQNLQS